MDGYDGELWTLDNDDGAKMMILQFGTFEFLQINVKKEPIEGRNTLCLFTLSPHYEAPSSMCIAPAAINQLGQDQCPASICDSN